MILPRVKIQFLNGQLGTVGESADGLLALICGAAAVAGTFVLNTAYTITSMDDLAELGVTATNNAALYKQVSEFYDEAGTGTKLVLYPVNPSTTLTNMCDYTRTDAGYARDLITKQNGNLRGIGIANVNTGASGTSINGIDPDVFTAMPKAQQLAEWATTELYAPLFFILEGRNFDPSKELKDMTKEKYDRVGIAIGDTVASSKGATIGTWLGRIAKSPVQRNIGRVRMARLPHWRCMWVPRKLMSPRVPSRQSMKRATSCHASMWDAQATSLLMTTWPVILQMTMRTSPTVG